LSRGEHTAQPRSPFLKGALDGLPFFIVIMPFAVLFGVMSTQAGLNMIQVMGFSFLVIAGAAQLTALQLMTEQAPTIIVIITALAVNLRMAMYSAALTPHFGEAPFWKRAFAAYFLFDQPYALSALEFEKNPDLTLAQKLQYYFGVALPIACLWWIATFLGALLHEHIPTNLGVDFAIPISFLALIAPMLRTIAHLATAMTSCILVILFADFPNGSGLLAASIIALIVGAQIDARLETRREARK
jgi:predicted branched-subunit amino acid permease